MVSPTNSEIKLTEWQKLLALLKHWGHSVKGFMGPASVYNEDGKAFITIWFVRSVCGMWPQSSEIEY